MRGGFKIVLIVVVLILIGALYYFNYSKTQETKQFEVNALFLKFSLFEGSHISRSVDVINNAGMEKDFFADVSDFGGMILLDKKFFKLKDGLKESLLLNLSTDNYLPGIYLGNLIIRTDNYNTKIPIVIEVQSKEVYFDSNVELFTKGDRIFQGERISSEIKIFDLSNIGRKSLTMEYFIKDFNNNDIIHESENLVVEGNLDISKSLNLPSNILTGYYILGIVVKYGESVGTSSLFFKISEKNNFKDFFDNNLDIIILIIFIFILFLLSLVFLMFYRVNVIGELRRMHKSEVKKEKEIMMLKRNDAFRKLNSRLERKVYDDKLKEIKKKRKEYLKKVYNERVSAVKKLKKNKDNYNLEKKIRMWKKKGYDTSILEKNINFISVDYIKKKVKFWRKKGYNTGVLKNKRF